MCVCECVCVCVRAYNEGWSSECVALCLVKKWRQESGKASLSPRFLSGNKIQGASLKTQGASHLNDCDSKTFDLDRLGAVCWLQHVYVRACVFVSE